MSTSELGEKKRMKVEGLGPLWFGRLTAGSERRLAEIDLRGNRPPWSEASFLGEFSNSHAVVFGCKFRSEIIGFGVVHYVRPEAHLLNFAISQEFRGLGAGRKLLLYIIDTMSNDEGCDSLSLEVRRSNSVAQSLYESLGFDRIAERRRYYPDDGEDALVMRAHLGNPAMVSSQESFDSNAHLIEPIRLAINH